MPLFPRSPSPSKGAEGNFALTCAKRLTKALFQHGVGRRVQSHAAGQKHFQQLVRDYGEALVLEVLDWFIPRIGQKYTPTIGGAFDFNDRFNSVWEAFNRDHTQVKITDQAHAVLDRLKYKDWPEAIEECIPAICQRSLDNYEPFRESLKDLHGRLRKESVEGEQARNIQARRLTLLDHLFNQHLWIPVDFVTLWVSDAPLLGWRYWTQMVFASDSDRLQQMGRGWSAAYMGEKKWWDSLMLLYREGK